MFALVLAKASKLVNTPGRTLIPDCTIDGRIGFMPPLLLGLHEAVKAAPVSPSPAGLLVGVRLLQTTLKLKSKDK